MSLVGIKFDELPQPQAGFNRIPPSDILENSRVSWSANSSEIEEGDESDLGFRHTRTREASLDVAGSRKSSRCGRGSPTGLGEHDRSSAVENYWENSARDFAKLRRIDYLS